MHTHTHNRNGIYQKLDNTHIIVLSETKPELIEILLLK